MCILCFSIVLLFYCSIVPIIAKEFLKVWRIIEDDGGRARVDGLGDSRADLFHDIRSDYRANKDQHGVANELLKGSAFLVDKSHFHKLGDEIQKCNKPCKYKSVVH